jgi:hypothetical protein
VTAPRWTTIGRNERVISINGRHFFSCRCNPSTTWIIDELDKPGNGARLIQTIATHLTTRDVTAYFKRNPL